jgi:hypothetical protein
MNYQAPLNKPMTAFHNPLCYHRRVSRHFTVRWPTRITSSKYYKIPSASKILIDSVAYWGGWNTVGDYGRLGMVC